MMADGGQKIGSCHARFSFRWNRSKMADTISSAGSMKWFSPKISRQMTPMPRPVSAGVCFFAFSYWSMKMMRKSAVIQKSMPVRSNGMI